MHDPCARSRCLQERTTQKYLQKAPVWSRPNTLRRLSQKCFYNSRVLERSQLRIPFYEDVGAFYSSEVLPPFLVEQVSSLQSKSPPCRASLLLVEQVFKNLKLGGQVQAFVLSWAPHKEWALPSLGPWTWAYQARQALSHNLSSSGILWRKISISKTKIVASILQFLLLTVKFVVKSMFLNFFF